MRTLSRTLIYPALAVALLTGAVPRAHATVMLLEFEGQITAGGFAGTAQDGSSANGSITGAVRGTILVDLGLAPPITQNVALLPALSFQTESTDPVGPQWITGQLEFDVPTGLPPGTLPFRAAPYPLQRVTPGPGGVASSLTLEQRVIWNTEPGGGAQAFLFAFTAAGAWENTANRETQRISVLLLVTSPVPFFTAPFSTAFEPVPVTGNGLAFLQETRTDLSNTASPLFGVTLDGSHDLAFGITSFRASVVPPENVPEPASIGLFTAGAAVLAGRAWNRKRKRAIL